MRHEFIDSFLQLFYFARNEELSPHKIALDMLKKRWLKYKPQAELQDADEEMYEDLSREQYLHLLLEALKAYCEWHGLKTFLHLLSNQGTFIGFTTSTDSVHRFPVQEGQSLTLTRMVKDIKMLT